MNISGSQYSKATVGMRQPTKLMDQQFKLVFIYPILCDSTLIKYKDLIRSFVSTSMLKEIYTSNALNIITMAGNISPLIDSSGNPIDIDEQLSSNLNVNTSSIKRQTQQDIKYELQELVRQKTNHIKKLLDVDPELIKLNPYIQIITMGNFIDVPIIVGTKGWDIDKFVLMLVLMVAVADKKITLSSFNNIQRIFNVIKRLNSNDINSLMNHLIELPDEKKRGVVYTWLEKHTPKKLFTVFSKPQPTFKTLDDTELPKINKDASHQILDIAKSNVNMAEIYFKLAMDSVTMSKKFGYDLSRGQLKTTFEKINPQIEKVFVDAGNLFTDQLFPNYIAPVLSSFLYTIVPLKEGINVSDMIIALQNGDNSKKIKGIFAPIIDHILGDLKAELNNTLEKQGPKKADETLKLMKNFCNEHFEETTSQIDRYNRLVTGALKGPDYRLNDHIQYEKIFEEEINKNSAKIIMLERALKTILSNNFVDNSIINKFNTVINDGLNSVVTYFNTFDSYPESTSYYYNESPGSIDNSKIREYISESKKQLIFYIRHYFLYMILYIMCKYVSQTEVAVETTKHDVLDTNNYTLVLPLSTIMLVANAYAAKSYRNLYDNASRKEKVDESGAQLFKHLNDNYVKKIVQFIHNQLNVPNLFVIDEKTGDVHYKLMYQSDVNKIKLNTMTTYINNILD
jgi:hypothetical protein